MNSTAYQPRRRIEQRAPDGRVTGYFETSLSDEQLAEQDRAAEERRAANLATNLATIGAERQRQQAEREALAGIGVDVEARAHLREAHRVLSAARDELARRREVVTAADRHVGRCRAAAAAAQQQVDGLACRAAQAIVEQLEKGESPAGLTPTRAAAEQAESARVELEHALAAHREVTALAEAAERAVADAEAGVKQAARGLVKLHIAELQVEIGRLAAEQADRRAQVNSLLPCLAERRWPVPWPAEAAALLRNPEAAFALAPEAPFGDLEGSDVAAEAAA